MKTQRQYFKATDKAQFDAALLSALNALGITEPFEGGEVPARGNFGGSFVEITEVEGEQIETTKRINLDWFVVSEVKARDEEGEFIVTETDEEGNPTAYQLEEGYHINTACNIRLTLEGVEEKTPEQPQAKFM